MNIPIQKTKIAVVGYGSVGRALTQLFHQHGFEFVDVFEIEDTVNWKRAEQEGFNPKSIQSMESTPNLLFLAVSDQHIEDTAKNLADILSKIRQGESSRTTKNNLVFHLSGRMGLNVLNPLKELSYSRVAFHPIQTFPTGATADRFKGVTIGVTKDNEAGSLIDELVKALGLSKLEVEEQHRADYHLASVLASNFLPILLDLGAKRLVEAGVDYEKAWKALMPLVKGMVDSMGEFGPHDAATGPVIRDDFEAVEAHSENLSNSETDFYIRLTEKLALLLLEGNKKDQEQYESWKRALNSISQN